MCSFFDNSIGNLGEIGVEYLRDFFGIRDQIVVIKYLIRCCFVLIEVCCICHQFHRAKYYVTKVAHLIKRL
jgi:hypothetical protein